MLPSGQISAIDHSTDVLEGIWPGWSKVGVWVEKALHSDGFCFYVPIKIQELMDAAWLTMIEMESWNLTNTPQQPLKTLGL